jgi:putative Holliday junction resolvase
MTLRGPVLALDYGSKRIGIAVSDPDGEFAFPAGVLERRGGKKDLEALRELVRERDVTRILVGLPLHLDGREGTEADAARAFALAVGEATGLPVELLDERWTTREAERSLRDAQPRRGRRQRTRVDAAAAALLLRTFLERERARESTD